MELNQLHNSIVKCANLLDRKGEIKKADLLDKIIKESSLQKLAQYVGIIGYVLKQNRCMSNCIRRKRVENDGPMQEVILSCLKEYQDGQDYHDVSWTKKYASVIQKEPMSFDKAHVLYMAEINRINDIKEHVTNIKKMSQCLQESNIDNSSVEELLHNYEILENIKNELV